MPYLNGEDKTKLVDLVKNAKYSEVLTCLESLPLSDNKIDLLEINFTKALCYKGLGRLRRAIFSLLYSIEFNLESKPIIIVFPKEITKEFKIKYIYFLSQLYLMTDQRETTKKLYDLIFSYFSEYLATPSSLIEIYRMFIFDSGLLALRIGEIDHALHIWEQFINSHIKIQDVRMIFLLGCLHLYKHNIDMTTYYFNKLKQITSPQGLYYKTASILCKKIEEFLLDKKEPFDAIILYYLNGLKNKGWGKNEKVLPDTFEDMLYLKLYGELDKFENI